MLYSLSGSVTYHFCSKLTWKCASVHTDLLFLIGGPFRSLAFASCPSTALEQVIWRLCIVSALNRSQSCARSREAEALTLLSPMPGPHPPGGWCSGSAPWPLHGSACSATRSVTSTPTCGSNMKDRGFVLVYRTNPKKLFFCSALGHHTLGRLLIPASLGLADAPCFLPSTPTMATLRLP